MFGILRNISDSYRYNKYVASTMRPLERDTAAEFLKLARPIFEKHAQASGMRVVWDVPDTKVQVTDYALPKGMSTDPKIRRGYNLMSKTKAAMTLHHRSDENDVQRGVIDILSSPRGGTLVVFRVPAVCHRYVKGPKCLDYLLQYDRQDLISSFKDGVPRLLSLREKKAFAMANKISTLAAGPGA